MCLILRPQLSAKCIQSSVILVIKACSCQISHVIWQSKSRRTPPTFSKRHRGNLHNFKGFLPELIRLHTQTQTCTCMKGCTHRLCYYQKHKSMLANTLTLVININHWGVGCDFFFLHHLFSPFRAVTDSINQLITLCTQQAPGQKECDNALRELEVNTTWQRGSQTWTNQPSY